MISYNILCALLLSHFVADFILQSDWMAKNKSVDNQALLLHVFTYTLAWIPFCSWYMRDWRFLGITFVTHFVTDWSTSRVASRLWKKGDTHNFFVCVGADQLIHYVTLAGTYVWLLSNSLS